MLSLVIALKFLYLRKPLQITNSGKVENWDKIMKFFRLCESMYVWVYAILVFVSVDYEDVLGVET